LLLVLYILFITVHDYSYHYYCLFHISQNNHKSLLRSSQGEVLEADASSPRRKLDDVVTIPPEGSSVRCLQEPNLVHRFAGGKLHLYPNGKIASSWNTNWRKNLLNIDCSGIPTGTPMSMKFNAYDQTARNNKWQSTTSADQDTCEAIQKTTDICNTCCSQVLTNDSYISSQARNVLLVGSSNTCARDDATGELYCWGSNHWNQLLDETYTKNNIPLDIVFGPGHTCMILQSHELKCWGKNEYGQLGLGITNDSYFLLDTPTTVVGLPGEYRGNTGAIQVALSRVHSCIIANNKNVYCWGLNKYASNEDMLGVGSREEYLTTPTTAVQLAGGIDIGAIQIAAGSEHTCAIDSNNDVQCWGKNYSNDSTRPLTIVALEGRVGAIQIAAYGDQTCVIDTAGNVQCWNREEVSMGGGDHTSPNPNYMPTIIPLGEGVLATQLGVGEMHVCALVNERMNPLKCWGWNNSGQLGDGTTDNSDTPTNVVLEGVEGVITELKTGGQHNCIVAVDDETKKVFCWGSNDNGQLGFGTTNDYISKPVLTLTMNKD
jgi:alpha-tubulin suppressor-like RCC1 family protein